MTLATTSLARVRYQKEAAFGVTDANDTTNKVKDLRITSESLAFSLTKSESAEIRSDRQTADLIVTNAAANGGINFELSYKEYDDLIEAVAMSSWAYYGSNTAGVGQGVGTSIAVTGGVTATTITATSVTTGTNLLTLLEKGQWFKLITTGGNGSNNGKHFRVHPTIAPTSTVLTVDTATPFTLDAGVTAVTISSARVKNGSTSGSLVERSFSVERGLLDVGQHFTYRGMQPSKFSLKMASGSITTGSLDFMGKDSVRNTTSQLAGGGGTPQASQTYDVQNGVAGIGFILENGAAITGTYVKSMDLSLDNSLRGIDALGVLGNADIAVGTLKVTGNLEVYLADGTLYDKFLNNTLTSIAVSTKDAAGNGYGFTIPAVRYGDAKVQAGGKDQDIMLSIPFTGIYDPTTGKMIIVDRFGV